MVEIKHQLSPFSEARRCCELTTTISHRVFTQIGEEAMNMHLDMKADAERCCSMDMSKYNSDEFRMLKDLVRSLSTEPGYGLRRQFCVEAFDIISIIENKMLNIGQE